MGVSFLNNLTDPNLRDPLQVIQLPGFYPFGYNLWLALGYPLFGIDYQPHVLAGLALYCLGILAAALAARRLFRSNLAGAGAALVCAALPGVTIYSKFLAPEGLLLPLVPLALWAYLASERLARPHFAALLGLVMAAGFLTKWSFGAYVGPLFIVLGIDWLGALVREPRLRRRRIGGMLISLGLLAVVAGPWYLLVFDTGEFSRTSGLDPYFLEYRYTANLRVLLDYFLQMIGRRAWPLIIATCGLALYLTSRPARRGALLLALAGIGGPLLIFAVPPHLDHRYLLPLLPLCAMIAPGLISGMPRGTLRRGLGLGVAVFYLATHVAAFAAQRTHPPAFETIMGPQHRGDLLWGEIQARQMLQLCDELGHARFPDKDPIIVASHPYWTNYHLWQNYLHYEHAADPELFANLKPTWEYIHFHNALRARDASRADVVLMDCGPDEDCLNRNRDYVERFLVLDSEDRYSMLFDQEQRGFTLRDMQRDLEILEQEYELVRRIVPDPGNTILIYLRGTDSVAIDQQVQQHQALPDPPRLNSVD
ncbi:MAG: glycosyltransferase family 39 protein [Candidatus Alcyoniella australis]|nr:glycosyltransferase family 39 protein [Candidatus Alcyoniella australis]